MPVREHPAQHRSPLGQSGRTRRQFQPPVCSREAQGTHWQVANTSGAKGQSLVIRLQAQGGHKAGSWVDYATGQYGDLINLLQERHGSVTLKETLREAQALLGEAPCPTVPREPREPREPRKAEHQDADSSKYIVSARKLFAAGKPVLGTVAAKYLQGRGITRLGPDLCYHPRPSCGRAKTTLIRREGPCPARKDHGQSGPDHRMRKSLS